MSSTTKHTLSIVIPCYYNGQNIPVSMPEIVKIKEIMPADVEFEYVLVDDGSKDNTYEELIKFQNQYPTQTKIVKLSGNFGAHNAALAGLNYTTGDCIVILAADMQDPPELIPKMYDYWKNGIKLVVANRVQREEPMLQRMISNTHHFFIQKLALPNIPSGGFDLVLFDRQLRDNLVKIDEKNTNQVYLLAWMKYDMVAIPYVRKKREIGTSKWTFQKKVKLFIDSFIAFSFFPIRVISIIGLVLGICAFIYMLMIVVAKVTGNVPAKGWSSLMLVFLTVSSFQMIALGIIGEYVWRTLDVVRNRPNFIVDKVIDSSKDGNKVS